MHYFINGNVFGRKVIEYKITVMIFPYTFLIVKFRHDIITNAVDGWIILGWISRRWDVGI